jgi:DNA mismatch endonuclease Vsr
MRFGLGTLMADVFSRSKRSQIMSRVKSTGNRTTELRLIEVFRKYGFRGWRRKSRIFGRPDFVFPEHRIAVFVDGCFWHNCPKHGQIRPEDFLTIISQMLDRHELLGWPYDGVMIDGLHNVYLQFPLLEQSEMVWPMLFQMLRTRGLTVVTTHTYFSIDPGVNAMRLDADDVDSARRRAAPLLHALVQATDFRVRVSPEKPKDAEKLNSLFNGQDFGTRVDILGAIGQPVASNPFYWDRDRGVVIGISPTDRARALSAKLN